MLANRRKIATTLAAVQSPNKRGAVVIAIFSIILQLQLHQTKQPLNFIAILNKKYTMHTTVILKDLTTIFYRF